VKLQKILYHYKDDFQCYISIIKKLIRLFHEMIHMMTEEFMKGSNNISCYLSLKTKDNVRNFCDFTAACIKVCQR